MLNVKRQACRPAINVKYSHLPSPSYQEIWQVIVNTTPAKQVQVYYF